VTDSKIRLTSRTFKDPTDLKNAVQIFGITLLLLLMMMLFLFYIFLGYKRVYFIRKERLVLAAIVMVVFSGLGTSVIHASVDYSTRYNYGEKGLEDAADFLEDELQEDDFLLCPKDIAYYVDFKPFLTYSGFMLDLELFEEKVDEFGITHVLVRKVGSFGIDKMPQDMKDHLEDDWDQIYDEDNFRVYTIEDR